MTGTSANNSAPMTMRERQQAYQLTDHIKVMVTLFLGTRIGRGIYDKSRLQHLHVSTLARIKTTLDSLHGRHLYRLLADTMSITIDPKLIDTYLDLLPVLTEEQRFIAADYFTTLARWNAGEKLSLDFMVYSSSQYLKVIGTGPLPCTTEEDQRVFDQLRNAPHLINHVIERVSHSSEITPALVSELDNAHPVLFNGAL